MPRWQWWLAGGAGATSLVLASLLLLGKKRRNGDPAPELATEPSEGPPGDREMTFWEHLEELRTRLLRSLLYITVGSVVGWIYYQPILKWVTHPVEPALTTLKVPILVFQNVAEPFLLQLQVSVAAGIALAFPFVLYEVLAFVWPALYPHEKRFALQLVPLSLALFLLGVATVYGLLPPAFLWLLNFTPKEPPSLILNFGRQYIWLVVKLMVAMGLVFQMPLVLMFLGRLGLVSARGLLRYWRHAIIAIFTISAIITPTWDPINMTLWAMPIVVLYFLSVLLVALVQRSNREP
jgi:sec-independent protein translocase protein TatC